MNRLTAWLDDRTGIPSAVGRFLDKRVPARLPWSYTLGSVALLLFLVQFVTGIFLAVYYAPTPDHAHDSLRYLESSIAGGRLLRALHHWGASFLVVAVLLHLLRVFLHGSYRKPREVNWLVGVKLLLFVMLFGLTGYLLPWDQKAYWATQVTLRVAGTVPLIGPFLASLAGGGPELGALTLTRFYAIHVLLLPGIALLLVVAHVALVQRHGTAGPPPRHRDEPAATATEPFHPRQSVRDALAMALVFGGLLALAMLRPAPLEAPADPTDSAYVPRPEWYFLGLFQLLKYFPGRLELIGTVILPGIGTALLFLLPWIDRAVDRRYGARKLLIAGGLSAFALAAALTILGSFDTGGAAEPSWRKQGRAPFPAIAGPKLAGTYDCARCHREDGFGIGPPLAGAGRSRSASWIRQHLADPEFVAPGTREPARRVPNAEGSVLLAYLELLAQGPPGGGTGLPAVSAAVAPPVDPGDTAAVALVLRENCLGCHRIDGVGGSSGPDLDGVAGRRSAQWIVDYLPDPEAVNPEARMKAFPDLALEDRERIAAYLGKLR